MAAAGLGLRPPATSLEASEATLAGVVPEVGECVPARCLRDFKGNKSTQRNLNVGDTEKQTHEQHLG